MKVAIIGAGNVGAMTASRIVDDDLADVVLMDIVPGLAKGKALDISDARPVTGSSAGIIGTESSRDLKGSDIVVITAGLARKPGMSRDDLLQKNAAILKDISSQIKKYCGSAIVIVVTNPLDAMTYIVMKETGIDPKKVIGMAGVLDSARFLNIASEKAKNVEQDKIFMMGSHGDSMVAINRSKKLSDDIFSESSERARKRGAEIVEHLKTGSAYFSPSASVFAMVRAVLKDEQKTLCASAYLEGQYGENDIYIGVPVKLGASGVKEIIEIKLSGSEKAAFRNSAQSIRESIKKLT
ncbi:MAG: malate dehydrogenase [Candidatus Omnitrophica bacterium]|nr:malate dehydrogenase [Candidatus Omnitrophota bacterium]MBU4589371.1 malate dehydrogenase [Candidatus Omnitrophota bacterium]